MAEEEEEQPPSLPPRNLDLEEDARERLTGSGAQQPIYADTASDFGGDYEEVVGPPAHHQAPPSFSGSGGGEDYEEVIEPSGHEEALYDISADVDQEYEEIPGGKAGGAGGAPSLGGRAGRGGRGSPQVGPAVLHWPFENEFRTMAWSQAGCQNEMHAWKRSGDLLSKNAQGIHGESKAKGVQRPEPLPDSIRAVPACFSFPLFLSSCRNRRTSV